MPKAGSNTTCLAIITIDSILKKMIKTIICNRFKKNIDTREKR